MNVVPSSRLTSNHANSALILRHPQTACCAALGRTRSIPHTDGRWADSRHVVSAASGTMERQEEAVQGAVGEDVQSADNTFVWREHWYPVALEHYLKKDTPQAITLLNIELVVWWGEDDQWHAAADKCPHKLAPMSEGRMDNGVLECRYHGWQFSAQDGSCIANPQSGRPAKACLDMYPTQAKNGLVWIWPQRGADAFLRASQQPVAKLPDGQMGFDGDNANYSLNPVSWALLLENSMDPSHAASLHEGPLGKRTDMVPMKMKVKEIHPTRGFSMTHDGYTGAQRMMGMQATRTFVPPHSVRVEYTTGDGKTKLMDSTLLIVPEKPGSAHTFGLFSFGGPPPAPKLPLPRRLKQGLPKAAMAAAMAFLQLIGVSKTALRHSFGAFKVANQDAIMLHHIDRLLVKENEKPDWRQYKLPTQSDAGAAAFWRWVSKFAGGDADWAGDASAAELPPKLGREELFNQWERHTKHCPDCRQGTEALETTLKRMKVVAGVISAAALLLTNRFGIRLALVSALGLGYLVYQKLDAMREEFYHQHLPVDGKRPAPQG